MTRTPEPAMTVRDEVACLNVDEKTVYRLSQRGELPGFKVAGHWRFKRSDLDEWIEGQKRAAPAKRQGFADTTGIDLNDEPTEAED